MPQKCHCPSAWFARVRRAQTGGLPPAAHRVLARHQECLDHERDQGDYDDGATVMTVRNKSQLREDWVHVTCLFMDEYSMVPSPLLSRVDQALRVAKENPDEPFGGINIIGGAGSLEDKRSCKVCQHPEKGQNNDRHHVHCHENRLCV